MIYYGCPKCRAAMGSPNARAGDSETCPQCGNVVLVPQFSRYDRDNITADSGPTGPSQYDPQHTGTVVAVEMTSKRLKFHHALSCLAIGVTYLGAYFTWDDSKNLWKWLVAAFVASGWFLWIKVLIWWRHG